MIAPTLTIAQARVLSELRKPGTKAYYMSGINSYWYLSPSGAMCTRQIEALRKLNLLQIEMVNEYCYTATAKKAEMER